jgi:hypothetical protein
MRDKPGTNLFGLAKEIVAAEKIPRKKRRRKKETSA